MIQSHLRDLLDTGKTALGAQLRFGTPAIAELYGHAGFDWLLIDGEHGPQSPTGIQAQLQAAASTPITPIVRPLRNESDLIGHYLDMGAMGVFVKDVRTPEQAQRAARACRYPPFGVRSFGPHRAAAYGFDAEYFNRSNDQVICMANIESEEAVNDIDRIVAVEGVDVVWVGPADLSISLGVPLQVTHPRVEDAFKVVVDAAKKAGRFVGGGVQGDLFAAQPIADLVSLGAQLIMVGGDEWMLCAAARTAVENFRATTRKSAE